jgi:hypothetical protein
MPPGTARLLAQVGKQPIRAITSAQHLCFHTFLGSAWWHASSVGLQGSACLQAHSTRSYAVSRAFKQSLGTKHTNTAMQHAIGQAARP